MWRSDLIVQWTKIRKPGGWVRSVANTIGNNVHGALQARIWNSELQRWTCKSVGPVLLPELQVPAGRSDQGTADWAYLRGPWSATMTRKNAAHIEPSRHSTDQVGVFLDMVEHKVAEADGAGSPASGPDTQRGDDRKPETDTPQSPRI
jgi:hypothetical protein